MMLDQSRVVEVPIMYFIKQQTKAGIKKRDRDSSCRDIHIHFGKLSLKGVVYEVGFMKWLSSNHLRCVNAIVNMISVPL